VDTATLPVGVTNSVDPDGGFDGLASVTLTNGEINLDTDFGYLPSTPNTIGGTVWEDANADGTLNESPTNGIAGVTIELVDTNGNVVAVTTTDADGCPTVHIPSMSRMKTES
jgi:hypothetical protein